MPLHIKLSTTLRNYVPDYSPATGIILELQEDATVASLAKQLELPLAEIKIVMVNGVHASLEQGLSADDRVAFFPAVGGG